MTDVVAPPAGPGRWSPRLLAICIAAIVLLAAFGLAVYSVLSQSSQVELNSIVPRWNEAIAALGIEPIYPPQEDISPGDVYAIITSGPLEDGNLSLLGRSVKLWHRDMSADLVKAYRQIPVFPNTEWHDEHGTPEMKVPDTVGPVLTIGADRHNLPLVLFPGFTIKRSRAAEGGFGALKSLFGASAKSDEAIELRVPWAETYGLDQTTATGYLDTLCDNSNVGDVCSADHVRSQLSMIVGDDAKRKIEGKYVLGVDIILINRVYLVRSIQETYSSDSSVGGTARILARLREATKLDLGSSGAVGSDSDKGKSASDQQLRLNQIIKELEGAETAGVASATAENADTISFTQTFPRPVVIGFRAVRKHLSD